MRCRNTGQFVYRGRDWPPRCALIPRQMYDVAIQAAIGSHIIARERIKAMRKDVLAKCYGGDITARKSCWKNKGRQKADEAGRSASRFRRMRFLAVLRVDNWKLELRNELCTDPVLFSWSRAIWVLPTVDVFPQVAPRMPRIPWWVVGRQFFRSFWRCFVLRSFCSSRSRFRRGR